MVPTLAAAAYVTRTIRLGTMVTNPHYRHLVTLAKDLITLDELSDGRITVGIGFGGTGFDATVLGNEAWTTRQRADRFSEFLPVLSRLLEDDIVTWRRRPLPSPIPTTATERPKLTSVSRTRRRQARRQPRRRYKRYSILLPATRDRGSSRRTPTGLGALPQLRLGPVPVVLVGPALSGL
jgi:alkanesulfonate monooxygenase SsuD/methylene tetrahydromethanopterin reductase-like flavin-dependent oxidoreductase (luciferase family)